MSNGLKKVKDDFSDTIKQMLDRTRAPQAGFARIHKVYQRLQTIRFQTENASEGGKWEPLQDVYRKYKLKRYGGGEKRDGDRWKSWPGSGTKTLIGTGTLAGAVIGPGAPFDSAGTSAHRALFTPTSMQIFIAEGASNAEGKPFDYAAFVNEERPFMEFGDASLNEMKQELVKFIFGDH
jgi:hypothetical protein